MFTLANAKSRDFLVILDININQSTYQDSPIRHIKVGDKIYIQNTGFFGLTMQCEMITEISKISIALSKSDAQCIHVKYA